MCIGVDRASAEIGGGVNVSQRSDQLQTDGVSGPVTPTDMSGLSALADAAPISAKPGVGADTPSPKALEAFALAEDDFEEDQESQSAHDRDLVDRVLTRCGLPLV